MEYLLSWCAFVHISTVRLSYATHMHELHTGLCSDAAIRSCRPWRKLDKTEINVEHFCSITQDSYPAIAGDYSTWVPPYSYASIAQLEENVGYIVDGVCLRNTTLKQLLVCPEGQESLPANELANHCQKLNIDCPEVID